MKIPNATRQILLYRGQKNRRNVNLVIRKLENKKKLRLMKESAGSWLLIQK